MILKHIYLTLSSDDHLIQSPNGSKFPFVVSPIVADFNFQSDFITQYIEKHLKLLKYETTKFETVIIRGRKKPKDQYLIEDHLKCLTIEIPFDENKYKQFYPIPNEYPLNGALLLVEDISQFNEFLFKMIITGLKKAESLEAPIPYKFLIDILLDFRINNYKNEWIIKKKKSKDGLVSYLKGNLGCNAFELELIIEKNNKEIYRNVILKSLPNAMFYKNIIRDLKFEENKLIVLQKSPESTGIFILDLEKLN